MNQCTKPKHRRSVCGLTTLVLPELVGQAPSDVAERSIDAFGKQWASGLEAVKGVKTGCETDDPHLGWITLFSTEWAQLYFM